MAHAHCSLQFRGKPIITMDIVHKDYQEAMKVAIHFCYSGEYSSLTGHDMPHNDD
jgi:hypothetical protein